MELEKLSLDDLLNQMEYNDGVDISAIREEIKKRVGAVNLSNLLSALDRYEKRYCKLHGGQYVKLLLYSDGSGRLVGKNFKLIKTFRNAEGAIERMRTEARQSAKEIK